MLSIRQGKMRFFFLLTVVLSSAITAAPAWASQCTAPCLPTILLSSGGTLPLDLSSAPDKPNNGIKTELQNGGTPAFEGEGFSVLFSFTNLKNMSDSSYLMLFLNVVAEPVEKVKCSTPGDRTGEELLPLNLFLLVYDSLTPLGVAALLLVSEFTVECGALKIKLKGSMLWLITPINKKLAKGSDEAMGTLHCSAAKNGVPTESKYWNEKAELALIPTLLTNFGAGFVKSCEEIVPPITLLPSEEMELMG
jgi:hypothetical protein